MNTPCPVLIAGCLFCHHNCAYLRMVICVITAQRMLLNSHYILMSIIYEWYSLLEKRGGLSLTSLRVILTVVVPASPPSWPPMSFAWINTWYCSFTSLSILGRAVFITPGEQQDGWEIQIIKQWETEEEERMLRYRDTERKEDKRNILDAKCSVYHCIFSPTEPALQEEVTCVALTTAEIEVIPQTGDTWHSIRELWWSHIMIHLRIRDPEIREHLYCRLIARSAGGWQAKAQQEA